MKKTRNYFIYCNLISLYQNELHETFHYLLRLRHAVALNTSFSNVYWYIHVLVGSNPRKWCSSTFLIVLMQVYNNSKQHPSFKKKKAEQASFFSIFYFFFVFYIRNSKPNYTSWYIEYPVYSINLKQKREIVSHWIDSTYKHLITDIFVTTFVNCIFLWKRYEY